MWLIDCRRNRYVGEIRSASMKGATRDQIIVATEENVLAALSTKTGDILWRKVLEKGDRGSVKLLHVPIDASQSGGPSDGQEVITVSGASPALIRGWNSQTGNIEWEWTLTPNTMSAVENVLWFYDKLFLYHVVPVFGSHLEVTAYYASTGLQVKATTTRISSAWISQASCVLTNTIYACVEKNQVIGIDLTGEVEALLTKPLARDYTGVTPTVLSGAYATIVLGEDIYALKSDALLAKAKSSGIFNAKLSNGNQILVQAFINGDVSINDVFNMCLYLPVLFLILRRICICPPLIWRRELLPILSIRWLASMTLVRRALSTLNAK